MTGARTTVIIPTLADEPRAATLQRAIDSVRQQHAPARLLVVVNGQRRSAQVMQALRTDPFVELVDLAEGSLVKALAAGVETVATAYFCVLDDDDVLLPHAVAQRQAVLDADDNADVVVAPGTRRRPDGVERPAPTYFAAADPMASIFEEQWLGSCSAMYRRARIGPDFFRAMPSYLEWTYLAVRLLLERRVAYLIGTGKPDFVIIESAGSASRSPAYMELMPANLERLKDDRLPAAVRRTIDAKITRALHMLAEHQVARGQVGAAWRSHLRSLARADGLRYLTYTRHLVAASLARKASASA